MENDHLAYEIGHCTITMASGMGGRICIVLRARCEVDACKLASLFRDFDHFLFTIQCTRDQLPQMLSPDRYDD